MTGIEVPVPIILRVPNGRLDLARVACHQLLNMDFAPYSAQMLWSTALDLTKPKNIDIAVLSMNAWGMVIKKQVALNENNEWLVTDFKYEAVKNVKPWTVRGVIESPYKGSPEEIKQNLEYADRLLRWCSRFRIAPWASHVVYTQPGVLVDEIEKQREHGRLSGLVVAGLAKFAVFGTEKGFSDGMRKAEISALENKRQIVYLSAGNC